jgi:hypothetical protein
MTSNIGEAPALSRSFRSKSPMLGQAELTGLEDRRKPAIQLDEEQAIAVRELDPTGTLRRSTAS